MTTRLEGLSITVNGSPCDITAGGFPRTQELRDSEKKRKRWLTLLYPGEIKATHRDHCYTTLAK